MAPQNNLTSANFDLPIQTDIARIGMRRPRSKNGCSTCRTKKVKCDEQAPLCSRCSRLGLECKWEDSRPSLRERRRGHGTIRSRPGWKPDSITPRPSSRTSHAPSIVKATPAFSSTNELHTFSSDSQLQPTDNLHLLGMGDSVLVSAQRPSLSNQCINLTQALFANHGTLPDLHDPSPFDELLSSSPINMMSSWDRFCSSWPMVELGAFPEVYTASATTTAHISATAMPWTVPLTSLDDVALDHYSTTYSISFTKKTPRWSTMNLLRNVAQNNAMLMHFILAISLQDLWYRGQSLEPELQLAAQKHYTSGTTLLAKLKSNESDPTATFTIEDHVHVLASFWFLYLYSTRSKDVDAGFLRRLSFTVTDHICRYRLDELCSSSSVQPQQQASKDMEPISCSARDGSLISLLIICLYFQDIKSGFYHRGGKIAAHLNSDKLRLGRIYDLCRNASALYWGTEYPIQELVDDSENYSILKFHSEMNMLLEDLNSEFSSTRHDPEANECFHAELEKLRAKYINVFAMSRSDYSGIYSWKNGSITPPNSIQTNAELSVAYFYAIEIYLFRCTMLDYTTNTPEKVQTALAGIIQIAGQVFQSSSHLMRTSSDNTSQEDAMFHRMEWPLFIAGSETRNTIYQDWILQKMHKRQNTLKTLEKIIEWQFKTGKRVGVEFMRQGFLPNESD